MRYLMFLVIALVAVTMVFAPLAATAQAGCDCTGYCDCKPFCKCLDKTQHQRQEVADRAPCPLCDPATRDQAMRDHYLRHHAPPQYYYRPPVYRQPGIHFYMRTSPYNARPDWYIERRGVWPFRQSWMYYKLE